MNVAIAYNSRGGNTRRIAERIAEAFSAQGSQARIVPVQRLTAGDVAAADLLFIGTWAEGLMVVRVRPAGAEYWLPALPDLAGKPTVAFASYLFRPAGLLAQLTAGLESKGARVVASKAFRRDRTDGLADLVAQALAAAGIEPDAPGA